MKKGQLEDFHESLKPTKETGGMIRVKQRTFETLSVTKSKVEQFVNDGWEIERELKSKTKLKKFKSEKTLFNEKNWVVFAKLDFDFISIDTKFNKVFLDECEGVSFDFLVADSETIILTKSYFSNKEKTISSFKREIEFLGNKKSQIFNIVKSYLPGNRKVKIVFITKNFVLSDEDKATLKNYGIIHFNEETITYYDELRKHLGVSTKYQLLGALFPGVTIPELDNKIPAIKGEMGGHTYYSFSIEPEKILKIGYVLHRNNANAELMPTYQRLIKKTRLKSIEDFINEGGYFPNSLVINIDTQGKKLQFDKSEKQSENSLSKLGILHLPKTYRSAYIIDGQHRLYGYSNTKYRYSNTVPVVAFINFDQRQQVRLFMDINQNQKAVPRSLKNDLDADLLWDSDKPKERIKALELALAIKLGEDVNSPLFNRVQLGENTKTETRCISTESIKLGLDKGHFFPQYSSKNKVNNYGTFFNENNDKTKELIYPFLIKYFDFISKELQEDWDMGEAEYGYLAINAGIENLIRIIGDICKYLVGKGDINPLKDSSEVVLEKTKPFLYSVINYFRTLTIDQKKILKKSYGAAGKAKYWRTLQEVIHKVNPDFNPDGLEKYIKDEEKVFNEESYKIIRDIETFMNKNFKEKLESKYGKNWFKKGVPQAVYQSTIKLAADKNYNREDDLEVEPWDCLNIIDYRKIALSNWQDLFAKEYSRLEEGRKNGNKEEKTKWMQKLESIRNENFHSYSVKEEEYEFLNELKGWLLDENQ